VPTVITHQGKVALEPKNKSGASFSVAPAIIMELPHKELGCASCRYSKTGCSRCRNPAFRPRTLAPPHEQRAVVTAQRRQAERHKQSLRKEQRKEEQLATSSAARQTLLQRLRTQLDDCSAQRPKEEEEKETERPAKKNARAAAHLPTPVEQPPAKYRRVVRESIHDVEMVDAVEEEETTPKKNKHPFLELLTDTMERNRKSRRASLDDNGILDGNVKEEGLIPISPLSELIDGPAAKRRKKAAKIEKLTPSPHGGSGSAINPRIATWEPPVSPYGLLEEELYENPWKLLVGCLLLNKTTAGQVRSVIWDLFKLIPTPEAAAVLEDVSEIENIIQPLGLFRKRAVAIKKMSIEFIDKDWRDPKELFNLGQYASDAYFIFCRGMWRDVQPEDKDLKRYKVWLESTGGLGSGLTR
jgi:methyl-CpG-binding domain protein 4